MKRRIVRLGLLLVCASLAGCQGNHGLRSNSSDSMNHPNDGVKVNDVESKPPKGFFKNSRLPGALERPGREIERDFGIR